SSMESRGMTMVAASSFLACGGELGFVLPVQLDRVNDADDGGVPRAAPAFGGHARGAAGNDQHGFAESRVHGVHGDQVAGFVAAFGINGLYDEEFLSFQARVFAGCNDGADDTGEDHEGALKVKSSKSKVKGKIKPRDGLLRPGSEERRNECRCFAGHARAARAAPIPSPRPLPGRGHRRLADGQYIFERLMRTR